MRAGALFFEQNEQGECMGRLGPLSIKNGSMNSPIRWAGSKRKLLPAILSYMPKEYSRYIEPFCGSLCLYLQLPEVPAVVSDINPELMHFYKMVRWRPRVVASYLSDWDLQESTYYAVRALSPDDLAAEARAARFLYLNRLCFNGVYRTNSRGEFNVPRGTRVPAMPGTEELIQLGARLRQAQLLESDFSETLSIAEEGDFVYLDPPYAGRDVRNRGEYGPGSFAISDIDRFQQSVMDASNKGAKILISYADVPVIRSAFAKWELTPLVVPRNVSGFARGRGQAGEVFLRNYC